MGTDDTETKTERAARSRITNYLKRKNNTVEQRLQFIGDCSYLTMRGVQMLTSIAIGNERRQFVSRHTSPLAVGACIKCKEAQQYIGPDTACDECGGAVLPLPPAGRRGGAK